MKQNLDTLTETESKSDGSASVRDGFAEGDQHLRSDRPTCELEVIIIAFHFLCKYLARFQNRRWPRSTKGITAARVRLNIAA